jgi:hypothetical protein
MSSLDSNNLFDLNELLSIEQIYSTEGIFYEPFFEFESKFASLQRYFFLNLKASRQFILESKTSSVIFKAKDNSDGFVDFHFEITFSDVKYFDDFIFSSVLTQMFSMFESFLLEVIEAARIEMNSSEPIQKDNIPLANRYIKWLTNVAGCEIVIKKETWAAFDVLREIRNRFVHAHIGQIPDQMKSKFSELKSEATTTALTENEGYVYIGFKTIADAVKQVELGFLGRFEK